MGLWGVIRQRSCRQVLERRPMSGSDSHTFLELGPGLCKGLQETQMIHPPASIKAEAMSQCWALPYLSLDFGNVQASHLKTCSFILKAALICIFMGITRKIC